MTKNKLINKLKLEVIKQKTLAKSFLQVFN